MTCKELVEVVTAYLDGVLSPAEREWFEAHLNECPGCANYVEQMRITIRLLNKLTVGTAFPRQRDSLIAAFRAWKTAP